MCDEKDAPAEYDVGAMKAKLNVWLANSPGMTLWDCIQYPFGDGGGSDCANRAGTFIPKAWGVTISKTVRCFKPAEQTEIPRNIYEQSHDTVTNAGRFVSLQVKAGWGGASKSRFKIGGGFHWVLVIDVGTTGQRRYSVIFDPDVTATKRALTAWGTCREQWESLGAGERKASGSSAADPSVPDDPRVAARNAVLQCMIVGNTAQQLGPLIRYHYES